MYVYPNIFTSGYDLIGTSVTFWDGLLQIEGNIESYNSQHDEFEILTENGENVFLYENEFKLME